MKYRKIVNGLFFLIVINSCNSDTPFVYDQGLIGSWVLTETLFDPGDGSGVFQPYSSNLNITFYDTGDFTTNGDLCNLVPDAGTQLFTGTYSLADSTISLLACEHNYLKFNPNLEDNEVVINFLCIEPCAFKFSR